VIPAGSVRRLMLIDRLRQGASGPVVSVVAPAGYGKTTLISQWAEANGQAFAWVSVDERDNDPKVLAGTSASTDDRPGHLAPAPAALRTLDYRTGRLRSSLTPPPGSHRHERRIIPSARCGSQCHSGRMKR